jgi:osmotically-inducible protein OsmY
MSKSLLHRVMLSTAGVALSLLLADASFAQQASMFGRSGPLAGPSGFGTGTTGTATMGGQGLGSPAFAKAGTGGAQGQSMGMSTGGQMGMGMGMGMNGQQAQGLLGASNPRNGLLGSARQGAGQQGNQGRNQGNNRGGNQRNFRSTNRGGGQQQNFTNQGSGNRYNSARSIRPQLKIAFDVPPQRSETNVGRISARFDKLSTRSAFRGVTLDTEGGAVVLRGQVSSEENRKLAGILVSMEPGVRSVKNELTVTPAAPQPRE